MTSLHRVLGVLIASLCLLTGCDGTPDAATLWREGRWAELAAQLAPRAEAGDSEAANQLGSLYYQGLGVPRDVARAAQWFERAALAGHTGARRHLGALYYQGLGVPRDVELAHAWLELAAVAGHPQAQAYMEAMANQLTPNQIMKARARLADVLATRGTAAAGSTPVAPTPAP